MALNGPLLNITDKQVDFCCAILRLGWEIDIYVLLRVSFKGHRILFGRTKAGVGCAELVRRRNAQLVYNCE